MFIDTFEKGSRMSCQSYIAEPTPVSAEMATQH